jgi:hypothetical protein
MTGPWRTIRKACRAVLDPNTGRSVSQIANHTGRRIRLTLPIGLASLWAGVHAVRHPKESLPRKVGLDRDYGARYPDRVRPVTRVNLQTGRINCQNAPLPAYW